MSKEDKKLPSRSSRTEVDAFLREVASTPVARADGKGGRLIFAMDATASREPTWDHAAHIQAEMFNETRTLGGLEVQLVFYRGFMELHASDWCSDAGDLMQRMTRVRCAAGQTQIGRVLRHAHDEARRRKVNALVFVGDCIEEDPAAINRLAGELGLLGLPAFVFHEGYDPVVEGGFRQLARLSGGAYSHFDASSPQQLRDLLRAVAVYAAGGRRALEDLGKHSGRIVRQLVHQLGKD